MSNDSELQLQITANADGAKRGFADAVRAIMGLEKQADQAGAKLDSMGDGAEVSGKKIDRATQNMINAIKRTTLAVETGGDALKKFERQAEMKGISRDVLRPYLNQLKEAKQRAQEAERATASWGASLTPLKTALGGLAAGVTFGATVGKLVDVQREFDKLNSSLITVTGSSANADAAMAWLKDFAKQTPFGLAQATEGFVKMKALGLEPTQASLTSFGNTASAMGKDLMQFVEAVADATTGQFERLREFGITAKKEGDNVALTFQGVTTTIKNNASEINQYLNSIGENQFAGAMAERAKTLDGAIAGLGDSWDELFRTISASGIGDAITDMVRGATDALDKYSSILALVNQYQKDTGQSASDLGADLFSLANATGNLAILTTEVSGGFDIFKNQLGGVAAAARALAVDGMDAAREVIRQVDADAAAAANRMVELRARIQALLSVQAISQSSLGKDAQGSLDGYLDGLARANTKPVAVGGGVSGVSRRSGSSGSRASTAKPKDDARSLYDSLIAATDSGIEADYNKKIAQLKGLKISTEQYQAAVDQLNKTHEFTKSQAKAVEEAYKAVNEQLDADRRLRLDLVEAENQKTAQYAEETQRMREQLEILGLTEDQIYDLSLSKIDAAIADKEFQLSMMNTAEMCTIEAEALQANIQALKDRRDVMGQTRQAEKAIKANEEFAASLAEVNDAFKKAFTESTGDIGDMFSDLWKSALAGFKNLVYQMTIQPIIIELGAMLTGNSYGAMASLMGINTKGGGLFGMANNASTANTVIGAINNAIWGSSAGASTASLAYANGVGLLGGDGLGALIAANGNWGGVAAGTGASAGSGAAGMGAAGVGALAAGGLFAAAFLAADHFFDSRPEYAGFASASTDTSRDAAAATRGSGTDIDITGGKLPSAEALAAIGRSRIGEPGLRDYGGGWYGGTTRINAGEVAAMLAAAGLDWADVNNDGRGTSQGFSDTDLRGLLEFGVLDLYEGAGYVDPGTRGHYDTSYNAEWIAMSRRLAEGVLSAVTSAARVSGQDVDLRVIAGLLDEGKKDELYGSLNITNGGETLVDWDEKVGTGQEYLRGVASATLDAFDKLDLPGWADDLVAATRESIDKLDAEELGDKLGSTALAAVDQLNAALAQMAAVLTALGQTVNEFNGLNTDDIFDITERLGGVDGFASAYNTYVSGFYDEEERQALLRRQVKGQFDAAGIALPDTREAFRALVDSLDLSTEAGQDTFATLMRLSGAFASLVPAAEKVEEAVADLGPTLAELYESAQSRTDQVWAAFEKNRQTEIDSWAEQESNWLDIAEDVRSVFDLLHEQVRSLYAEVDDTRAMQTEQARAFIAQSLTSARATGSLPDVDKLGEAIDSARNGLDVDNFATRAEYEIATLELAGQLAELEKYAGTQLSAAEQGAKYAGEQVKLLTEEKDYWAQQFELLRTTNTSLGTIEELAKALLDERKAKEAADAEANAKANAGAGAAGGLSFGVGGGAGRSAEKYGSKEEAAKAEQRIRDAGGYAYVRNDGGLWSVFEVSGAGGFGALGNGAADLRDLKDSGASGAEVLEAAMGMKVADIATALGGMPDDWAAWLRSNGYTVEGGQLKPRHSFDVGSPFIPRDMVAQLHAREMVVKPMDSDWFRAKAAGMSDAQAAELINAVREMSNLVGQGNLLNKRAADALEIIQVDIGETLG